MLPVFRKEINGFFSSPVAYVIMVVFLTAVGLMLWVFPDTSLLDYGYADLGVFFNLTPYVMLFLIPAITMRSIAEEVRAGTIEWLLTKPLTRWQLVLAKFGANWLVVVLLLLPTLLYYYSVYQLGNPVGNLDSASVFGSYVGLLLLGGVFVAVGLFASSINENQVVAFVVGVFLCFLLYVGISSVADLSFWGTLSYPLTWLALDEQYQALGRGLIDSRNVIYLLSVITVFLVLTEWRMTALTR
ncbi:gliding motility-associated ABC transporter permease subunit GldF [Larkinella punicea]|uniref:Gliding motility-associated ABC transporter permease subunit GldF n=1 Tax=Larkinella punicea TaxID=2315727 RepID=A0A368JKC9_9BACT|nr:gliding motility-associated ABC transporter permease subunit GldF [Larkinella punicea]RCR66571.1 gliding motility-associated ABC transporter permease subunit GldF [Larkinella punicea]